MSDDNHPFSQNSICIILNICCTMDGQEKQFVQNKKINYQKFKCVSWEFQFYQKVRREHGPANTKTIGKINSFTVSRCFISHIHSLTIIGKLSAAEQFRKFKFCKKHISCSTTPLLIQGHTEVVFLANIGNFTSRRRIFGLRFLYFVFWHFRISIIFCFQFEILGIFFTHI